MRFPCENFQTGFPVLQLKAERSPLSLPTTSRSFTTVAPLNSICPESADWDHAIKGFVGTFPFGGGGAAIAETHKKNVLETIAMNFMAWPRNNRSNLP
jgi:hypothetical protein